MQIERVYLVELGSAEEGVDFFRGPNKRQALLVRQEVKIWRPGRGVPQTPLEHEGDRKPKVAVETGGFDEFAGGVGPDGEAGLLGDSGHHVAFTEMAESFHRKTGRRAVAELEGVAVLDPLRLHPPLERPHSSCRRHCC